MIILMYHRVADETCDPWGLCVAPRHFEQQMEVLRKSFSVTPICQLAVFLAEGKVPRGSVAITFDDGYADNVHAAKTILERHELPATLFVVSKYVGGQIEFWWDELDRLLLQPGTLPDRFELNIGGRSVSSSQLTLNPSCAMSARSQATADTSRTPIPTPTMCPPCSASTKPGLPIQSSSCHQSSCR